MKAKQPQHHIEVRTPRGGVDMALRTKTLQIVKVGINFDMETHNITDWKVEE